MYSSDLSANEWQSSWNRSLQRSARSFYKATKLIRAKKLKVFLIARKVLVRAKNYLRMSGGVAERARFEIVFTVTP